MANNDGNKGHNSNRDPEMIKQAVRDFDEFATPIENEIKVLQKKINDKASDIKKDTKINKGELMAFRKVAKILNPDEKRSKLCNFRLVYEALSPGDHVNWVDALEPATIDDEDDDTNAE